MSVPQKLPNPVKIFSAILEDQRDDLNHLATIRGLTDTKTVYELLTRAAHAFLVAKPWKTMPNWEWVRPQSYYLLVDGEREPNGSWLSFNTQIGDLPDADGNTIRGKDIVAALNTLGAKTVVPWLKARDLHTHGKAQNAVYYSIIVWALGTLYRAHLKPSSATPVTVRIADLADFLPARRKT